MKAKLRKHYEAELNAAKNAIVRAEWDAAFLRLERAHILGQAFVVAHVRVHWRMLRMYLARGEYRHGFGQGVRLVLGAIGSSVGRVPVGNTGGSDVRMLQPMTITAELQAMLDE